uniref:Homeobox domain-containing protein n=1 Tax=Globodera rostochiensis TaxID=31243 RepID=A0A914HPG1_GLORO
MEEFWILILVSFFAINSLDKAESVQLEEKPFKIIDEIFGEGWWDNDKDEEWHKLTLEQNFHHQIDRQNTQIGQIEPNSTAQLGQIEPNSTDQNPPLIESDHSGQIEPNSTDQNPPIVETIYAWKLKLGQTKPQHKYSHSEQKELLKHYYEINDKKPKISDEKIAKMLKIDVSTLRRWKKLHPNVVDGHSVEKDAAGSNIQDIENSNLGSI